MAPTFASALAGGCYHGLPARCSVHYLDLHGPRESGSEPRYIWPLVRVALAAMAPFLVSLRLVWPGPLRLDGPWLSQMKHLQLAWVEAEFIDFTSAQMAGLQRLEGLELRARRCKLELGPQDSPREAQEGGPLPAGLRRLGLCTYRLKEFPTWLSSLTSLASLSVTEAACYKEVRNGHRLSSLTTLQELQLSGLEELPTELGLLTKLRVLYIDDSFYKRPPPDGSRCRAVLGGMASLAVLSLRESHVPNTVLDAVAGMTTLRCLVLNGRCQIRLCPGPYLKALEVLSLSWDTLLYGHEQLSACTQLSKLYLGNTAHLEHYLVGQLGEGEALSSDESGSDGDADEDPVGWDGFAAEAEAEDAAWDAEADGAEQQEGAAAEGAAIAAAGVVGPEVQQGPAEPALVQLAAQAFGPPQDGGGGLALEQQPPQQQQQLQQQQQQQLGEKVPGGGLVPAAAGPAAEATSAALGPSDPLGPHQPKTQLDVTFRPIAENMTFAVRELGRLLEEVRSKDPGMLRSEGWEEQVVKILQASLPAIDALLDVAVWVQRDVPRRQALSTTLSELSDFARQLSFFLSSMYTCTDVVARGWREVPAAASTAPWLKELVAELGQGGCSSELLQLAAASLGDDQSKEAAMFSSLPGLHKLMLEVAVKADQAQLALQALPVEPVVEQEGPPPPPQQQQEVLEEPEAAWTDSTWEQQEHGRSGERLEEWAAAGFSNVPPGGWGDGSLRGPDQRPHTGYWGTAQRNARQALDTLSSLPALRHVLHVFPDGEARLWHFHAQLLHALPLRCPWLRVSASAPLQIGWRLADVLRNDGK
ncbi:hypothetical protein N2152v2_005240 [Parachlorella kessleri]